MTIPAYTRTWESSEPIESIQMSSVARVIREMRVDVRERVNVLSPVGLIMQYFGDTIPDGWLECDGSAISRTTYAGLFALISTKYGLGDGSTTFNIPDLRAMFARGQASAVSADLDAINYRYITADAYRSYLTYGVAALMIVSGTAPNVGDYIMNLSVPVPTKVRGIVPGSPAFAWLESTGTGAADYTSCKTLIFSGSIRGVNKNGVISSGSAIITGINDTSTIETGLPIIIKDFLGTSSQEVATVLSVDSPSQITASRAAISSNTYSSGEIFFVSRKTGAVQLSRDLSHAHPTMAPSGSLGNTAFVAGSSGYVGTGQVSRVCEYAGTQGRPKNFSCRFLIRVEGVS